MAVLNVQICLARQFESWQFSFLCCFSPSGPSEGWRGENQAGLLRSSRRNATRLPKSRRLVYTLTHVLVDISRNIIYIILLCSPMPSIWCKWWTDCNTPVINSSTVLCCDFVFRIVQWASHIFAGREEKSIHVTCKYIFLYFSYLCTLTFFFVFLF